MAVPSWQFLVPALVRVTLPNLLTFPAGMGKRRSAAAGSSLPGDEPSLRGILSQPYPLARFLALAALADPVHARQSRGPHPHAASLARWDEPVEYQ